MRTMYRLRQRENALLATILLLAALLRLGWPALTEFKADEARLLRLSLQMAAFESFPLRGISTSVGLPNFPASVWLYALPLAVWRHPLAPILFTGLLNVLAIAGTYWLARRAWGPRVALFAALLFAVCPWAIVHSRKIWGQNLLPPLVLGWGLSAMLAFVERRAWFLAAHIFLLAAAVQVHFVAAALVPATGFFLTFFRRRLRRAPFLLGAAAALLTALPFLLHLLQRDEGLQPFLAFMTGGDGGVSLAPWRYTFFLSTGSDIHSLAGPQQFQAYLRRLPPMVLVYALWLALMVGGLLFLLRQLRSSDRAASETALILLVWLLAPPLFFTWFPGDVALHYLLSVYPVPFLLAALGLHWVGGRAGQLLSLALLISAAVQVAAWAVLLNLLATQATPGGAGPPLALHLQAAEQARRLASQSDAQEILIAGSGEDPGESEFAAVYDALLWDLPHRFVDATRAAVFPAAPAVVLLDAALTPADLALYHQAATTARQTPLRRGEGVLHILALPAHAAPASTHRLPTPAILANYVKILGYGAAAAGEPAGLRWQLHWQTADSPVPQDYHFFNHLLDAAGQRVAQSDAPAFDPAQWRQGDVVVSTFTLSLPPDSQPPYSMRSGMYHYPGVENVSLVDVAGNPAADAIEVEIGDLSLSP